MSVKNRFGFQFAYGLRLKAIALYYVALALALASILLRKNPAFWSALPGDFANTWGTHISNFAISYLVYTGVGLMWILQGVHRKAFIWLGGVLLALNIIIEGFVTILNTPDMIDALFGVLGVLAGGLVLFLLNKSKVKIRPKSN